LDILDDGHDGLVLAEAPEKSDEPLEQPGAVDRRRLVAGAVLLRPLVGGRGADRELRDKGG
jgi:hypothetical protein